MSLSDSISPALEDYLEVILHLSEEGGTVKVSDIARRLNIAKSSVTQAIVLLKKEDLVHHDRYGPVVLTEKGKKKAENVWHRHKTISLFLEQVLKVSPITSEQDACKMEHIISQETMDGIEKFLYDLKTASLKGKDGLLVQPKDISHMIASEKKKSTYKISELAIGTKAKVLKISTQNSKIRKRIMEMGLVPGSEIEVVRYAPLGDPIELNMKGYNLSLRLEEAETIWVDLL